MIQDLPRLAVLLAACSQFPATGPVIEDTPIAQSDRARLVVEVEDDRAGPGRPLPLPVRAIVTASDGTHPDGSGRGTYADGRFFADGHFAVDVPPGRTRVLLRIGPDYEPLELPVEAKAGRQARLRAPAAPVVLARGAGLVLRRQPRPRPARRDRGHQDGPGLHGVQARADGLSYVTEADGGPDPADLDRLSTPTFLFRRAPELRPGPFVGHLNTPGLSRPIEAEVYARLVDGPLPAMRIAEEIHRRGGAVIHTHPLTPPHQLHWMAPPRPSPTPSWAAPPTPSTSTARRASCSGSPC